MQDTTSGFDSSDDEPSSGYQTSHILSPQLFPAKSVTNVTMTRMKVILHCQDLYRNHLVICPVQTHLNITQGGAEPGKYVGSVDIDQILYLAQGQFYQVGHVLEGIIIMFILSDY